MCSLLVCCEVFEHSESYITWPPILVLYKVDSSEADCWDQTRHCHLPGSPRYHLIASQAAFARFISANLKEGHYSCFDHDSSHHTSTPAWTTQRLLDITNWYIWRWWSFRHRAPWNAYVTEWQFGLTANKGLDSFGMVIFLLLWTHWSFHLIWDSSTYPVSFVLQAVWNIGPCSPKSLFTYQLTGALSALRTFPILTHQ